MSKLQIFNTFTDKFFENIELLEDYSGIEDVYEFKNRLYCRSNGVIYKLEPSKLESFVDGKTRLINAYNTRDDPWILDYADQVIKENPGFYNI